MVRLRVTARIIPEDVYLRSLDFGQLKALPGEKRPMVIIPNPENWLMGHLAHEVREAFRRTYKYDLGKIKYIKDPEDDADLDTEMSVYDALVNEGKAILDGSDQRATIKIIQEQGLPIREGSIVPDLSAPHFQVRPRPPVPKFPRAASNLGKRERDVAFGNGEKSRQMSHEPLSPQKTKLPGIDENISEQALVPSIERDVQARVSDTRQMNRMPSVELVQDSQIPRDLKNLASRQGLVATAGEDKLKSESPDLQEPFQDLGPTSTIDLEIPETGSGQAVLQEREEFGNENADGESNEPAKLASGQSSCYFSPIPNSRHSSATRTSPAIREKLKPQSPSQIPTPHGPSAMKPLLAFTHNRPNPPITPPSDAPVSQQRPPKIAKLFHPTIRTSSTPSDGGAGPSKKFKALAPSEPDSSEIDDSQMSPRSKKGKSNRKITTVSTATPSPVMSVPAPTIPQPAKRPRRRTKVDETSIASRRVVQVTGGNTELAEVPCSRKHIVYDIDECLSTLSEVESQTHQGAANASEQKPLLSGNQDEDVEEALTDKMSIDGEILGHGSNEVFSVGSTIEHDEIPDFETTNADCERHNRVELRDTMDAIESNANCKDRFGDVVIQEAPKVTHPPKEPSTPKPGERFLCVDIPRKAGRHPYFRGEKIQETVDILNGDRESPRPDEQASPIAGTSKVTGKAVEADIKETDTLVAASDVNYKGHKRRKKKSRIEEDPVSSDIRARDPGCSKNATTSTVGKNVASVSKIQPENGAAESADSPSQQLDHDLQESTQPEIADSHNTHKECADIRTSKSETQVDEHPVLGKVYDGVVDAVEVWGVGVRLVGVNGNPMARLYNKDISNQSLTKHSHPQISLGDVIKAKVSKASNPPTLSLVNIDQKSRHDQSRRMKDKVGKTRTRSFQARASEAPVEIGPVNSDAKAKPAAILIESSDDEVSEEPRMGLGITNSPRKVKSRHIAISSAASAAPPKPVEPIRDNSGSAGATIKSNKASKKNKDFDQTQSAAPQLALSTSQAQEKTMKAKSNEPRAGGTSEAATSKSGDITTLKNAAVEEPSNLQTSYGSGDENVMIPQGMTREDYFRIRNDLKGKAKGKQGSVELRGKNSKAKSAAAVESAGAEKRSKSAYPVPVSRDKNQSLSHTTSVVTRGSPSTVRPEQRGQEDHINTAGNGKSATPEKGNIFLSKSSIELPKQDSKVPSTVTKSKEGWSSNNNRTPDNTPKTPEAATSSVQSISKLTKSKTSPQSDKKKVTRITSSGTVTKPKPSAKPKVETAFNALKTQSAQGQAAVKLNKANPTSPPLNSKPKSISELRAMREAEKKAAEAVKAAVASKLTRLSAYRFTPNKSAIRSTLQTSESESDSDSDSDSEDGEMSAKRKEAVTASKPDLTIRDVSDSDDESDDEEG